MSFGNKTKNQKTKANVDVSFKFIHTADWQLGAPFGAFDNDLSARLTAARLDSIKKIADLAHTNNIEHVIVAGDVWDSEQPSNKTLMQPIDLMKEQSSVTWWLMPGNHDPFRQNMLWSRIENRIPSNVRLMLESKPYKVSQFVWLLPAPWTNKFPGRDLTEWMDDADVPSNAVRIGVAHGSVVDFSMPDSDTGESGSRSVINPNRVEQARLDYLALGDWHGTLRISDFIWYSGTPEIDRFRRNNPGHVLIVEVEKGIPPKVQQEKTTEFNWRILDIECFPDSEEFQEIDQMESRGSLLNELVQINLTGQITQKNWQSLEARLQRLEERVAYLDIRKDNLNYLFSDEDFDGLDRGGSVRMTADKLFELRNNSLSPEVDRKIASDALRLLFSYSAQGLDQ